MGYEEDDDNNGYFLSDAYYIAQAKKELEYDIGAPFDAEVELEKEKKKTTEKTKGKPKKEEKKEAKKQDKIKTTEKKTNIKKVDIKEDEKENDDIGDGPHDGDKKLNNPYFYVKELMKDNKFLCFEGEEILYWFNSNTGTYSINGDSIVKKLVQKISNKDYRGVRKNHVSETIALIQRNFMKTKSHEDEYKYILLVGNGIIDMNALKNSDDVDIKFSLGFDSDYFILSGIPWKYIPGTDCPRIKRFLIELVVSIDKCRLYPDFDDLYDNLTSEERAKSKTLLEYIGYCLLRSCDFKKCLILKGGPDSGKSKYTDLVEYFLGHDSCSGISLQEMRQEYNIAEVYGKMANIRAELSGKRLDDTSIVKIFINGDPVMGRIIRTRPTRFRPYAKLLYATNIIPAVPMTEDDSFFGKIILIDCPNKFPRNDSFFDTITTPEEMSGLLNAAIDGLKRLMKNKRFSYETSTENVSKRFPRYGGDGNRTYGED
jgi:putative DNA primase/helicase